MTEQSASFAKDALARMSSLAILVMLLLVAACATQTNQAVTAAAVMACSDPVFQVERTDCQNIATLAFSAMDAPRADRTTVQGVEAALRRYSPYGPTDQGWKGISPGRLPGETGARSLADGTMLSVQMLDLATQMAGRAPSQDEIATAIVRGLRPR